MIFRLIRLLPFHILIRLCYFPLHGLIAFRSLQPLLKDRPQLLNVSDEEPHTFKLGDGGVSVGVSVEFSQQETHFYLGKTQLLPSLFELLDEILV